jgi:16S rRNA (cytosine967-C5)-methyltransferase
VVQAVRAGRSLTAELASVTPELRPGVQALTFQVMRQLGRAMALRERLASKAPPPAADALLCTALALSWQGDDAPYPVHTLVNQAVEAARQQRQTQAQSGFINGCLRRFLREREALVAETDSDPQARWNHPRWWVTRVQDEYPEDWQKLLDMAQQPAPMSLRVDPRHHSVADYPEQLLDMGLSAQPSGASG